MSPTIFRAGGHVPPHHSLRQALCIRLISFADWNHRHNMLLNWRRAVSTNLQQKQIWYINLFFWYSWRASISFCKGKARAAGIIWQRISCTGACKETAKFNPGRSPCSLFIAWIIPTYRLRNNTTLTSHLLSTVKQNSKEEVKDVFYLRKVCWV